MGALHWIMDTRLGYVIFITVFVFIVALLVNYIIAVSIIGMTTGGFVFAIMQLFFKKNLPKRWY
jgi:hypothetical protein